MIFTDGSGAAWTLYDYVQHIDRRERVPLGDRKATARAFVSPDRRTVLVYQFGLVAYRDASARTLTNQLKYARPLDAPAARRLDGGVNEVSVDRGTTPAP